MKKLLIALLATVPLFAMATEYTLTLINSSPTTALHFKLKELKKGAFIGTQVSPENTFNPEDFTIAPSKKVILVLDIWNTNHLSMEAKYNVYRADSSTPQIFRFGRDNSYETFNGEQGISPYAGMFQPNHIFIKAALCYAISSANTLINGDCRLKKEDIIYSSGSQFIIPRDIEQVTALIDFNLK